MDRFGADRAQARQGHPTAAHVASWTSADSIFCIANRYWNLMPLARHQKLFPHFRETGTAVFAVEEVEYGRHDLVCLLCTPMATEP